MSYLYNKKALSPLRTVALLSEENLSFTISVNSYYLHS